MSREHAPAVKELVDDIVSSLIISGVIASADRGLTGAFIARPLAKALAPLLKKAQECCIGIVTQGEMRDLRIELARWEPPKTEDK